MTKIPVLKEAQQFPITLAQKYQKEPSRQYLNRQAFH